MTYYTNIDSLSKQIWYIGMHEDGSTVCSTETQMIPGLDDYLAAGNTPEPWNPDA